MANIQRAAATTLNKRKATRCWTWVCVRDQSAFVLLTRTWACVGSLNLIHSRLRTTIGVSDASEPRRLGHASTQEVGYIDRTVPPGFHRFGLHQHTSLLRTLLTISFGCDVETLTAQCPRRGTVGSC